MMPNGIKLHSDQWTLGDMLAALNGAPQSARVSDGNRKRETPFGFDSYRGFYEDACLMVGEHHDPPNVSLLRSRLEGFLRDGVMHGYKGGSYSVRVDTPLWIDGWGCASGRYVVGMSVNKAGTIARVLSKQEGDDE